MNVAQILKPEHVRFAPSATSKKHALTLLSEILAESAQSLDPGTILDHLVTRERLGSTALGKSVAMPHARISGIQRIIGAFLRLGEGIDFQAPDGRPVSLLFGLLMPTDCSDNEIAEFRELIEHVRDPLLQDQLRATEDAADLYTLLTDSLTAVYRRLDV